MRIFEEVMQVIHEVRQALVCHLLHSKAFHPTGLFNIPVKGSSFDSATITGEFPNDLDAARLTMTVRAGAVKIAQLARGLQAVENVQVGPYNSRSRELALSFGLDRTAVERLVQTCSSFSR